MPKVVDFPLPLGPRIPYTCPFSIEKERFFTAVKLPNFLVRLLTVSIFSKIGYVLLIDENTYIDILDELLDYLLH